MIRLASFALAMLLAGWATVGSARDALPAGARYVAMGSSFAAGPGLEPIEPNTPARCTRSTIAYPALLARRLRLNLVNQTCSGATTHHILGHWNEVPPQIDAVNSMTRLVTITIGGNDLGYVGNLFRIGCAATRRAGPNAPVVNCLPPVPPSEQAFVDVERNMNAIAKAVRRRAPDARLVFVQYITLMPDKPCRAVPLTLEEIVTTRAVARRLSEITARVARANRADVLRADRLSRNHTPCDAVPWTKGYPPDAMISPGAPWHLNAAGMVAVADALAAMIEG